MCYFLTIASPLTLSEVRSMLPAGLAAQPVEAGEATALRRLFPAAQTVAVLLVGGCSCDLVRERDPNPREDERLHRAGYSRLGLPRERIVSELERHRQGTHERPLSHWTAALSGFVAEHARNAGPTLFALRFGPRAEPPRPWDRSSVIRRTLAQVGGPADTWLDEDRPALVVR